MAIQLLYVDGCPNWPVVAERPRRAMWMAGRSDEIEYPSVQTPEQAAALRFGGSPTILIDGRVRHHTGLIAKDDLTLIGQ